MFVLQAALGVLTRLHAYYAQWDTTKVELAAYHVLQVLAHHVIPNKMLVILVILGTI